MNSSKIAGFLARGIFAAMLGYCVWISGREFFHTHRAPPPEYISAYREIARKVNADPVAFLCENPSAISPLERSKLAVLAWELVPQAAEPIGLDNIDGRRGEIVASAYLPASVISKLETSGFASVASNEFATVWRARDDYSVSPYRVRYSANKEDAGLLCSIIPILFVFIVGCLLKGKQCGEKASYELTLAGIILGIVLSLITTSMNDASLAVPNGFAVFVGKAKLLMAEGGLPQGFFTNSIYSVYQPAYPLGMTILSAIAFLFSGGYYECSFMPTGPWLMFALVTILGDRKSVALSLSVGVLALSPLGRMLLTGQYAEPAAAMAIAFGCSLISQGRIHRGFAAVGLAGLFRPEGAALAFAIWFAALLTRKDSEQVSSVDLALALAPGLLWAAFVWSQGGTMQDFSLVSGFASDRMFAFCERVGAASSVGFAEIGALPLIAYAMWRSPRRQPYVVFALISILLGAIAAGFNTSPYFTWVLDNCVPRYCWLLAAAVPLCKEPNSSRNLSCKIDDSVS